MNKTVSTLTLFVIFGFTTLIGQNLDVDYVRDWLKKSNEDYTPELVEDFYINGEHYQLDDIASFNQKLKKIQITNINTISYSSMNSCNYSSGNGEIYIKTKSAKSQTEIKKLIELVTNIYNNEKPMIIVIDNKIQKDIIFSELISEFDISKIYDIGVSPYPVPKDLYGVNAENGIIKIWTK